MPLTRYQIRNEYSLADPELYKAPDRDDHEALLEGVAMAGLVGVLRQLGDLAEFGAEIFHDLHEEVMATAARGHCLMVRVQQLEAEVPTIEKAFLSQTNPTPFYSNAGVDWCPNLRSEQNLITRGDLPRCVMDSYEECRGPPQLFLLDKFDVAGPGACLKRYTDPSFFKVETAPSEPYVEVRRERKFRKVKKKGSHWKNGKTPEIVPTSHAKLYQLFLEETVEKGQSDPAHLVKLKKRQLNAQPFDLRSGKILMEKFLETLPERNGIRGNSVCPFPLNLSSDNSSELEIYDIAIVSPVKETSQGKESTCSTPNAHEVVLKPSMDDWYGKVIDRQIVKVLEPSANVERDEIHSIHHKVMDEREIAVDGEVKPEGSVDGGNSDDMISEVDNYMDALTTMESEMETGHEYRLKSDLGFSNIEKHGIDPDRKGEQLEFEAHSSDSQSIENFSASDDGNSSFKKGSSSFSYSDTVSNLAEFTPSDGEGSAKEFPTSEAFIPENPEMPCNQLRADVAVLRTKSHELMLPNDMCIDDYNICSLGEASSNCSLAYSNYLLPPLDPATGSLQHQSDETPSESVELGFALSYSDERETNLADTSAVFSGMPSHTSDSTPAVSSESHSVDKLDGEDPHVSSDVSFHLSNNSELAPEKKSSYVSPDEVLQIDFAGKRFPDNTVDIKVDSSQTNTPHTEEQVPYSVLSEVEGSDVEKLADLVSEAVDALPEPEVYWENSTSTGDASQNCRFKEQKLSDVVDDIPPVELESAEETAICSEEANIADTSGTADCKKRGASTCMVDAADRDAVPENVPYSVLSEVEGSDVEKLADLVSEAVDALPETEVYWENSTSTGDASQNCRFKEQKLSDVMDNIPQVALESAEETAICSGKANTADTSATADSEKRGASTCMVDAVDGDAVPVKLPSNYMDCSVLEDHAGLEDVVAESVQAENMAVYSAATDDVSAEAGADDDVEVVYPLLELICSPSKDTEDPLNDGLECNELVSREHHTGPEAENEATQMEVSPKDVNSASCKLISCDEINSEMVDGVQNSLADVTQNRLPAGDVTNPPTSSGLNDHKLESKSLHQSHLLDGGEDAMSSPSVHLPNPEISLEQPLELQADELEVECMKVEASSNSPNHLSEQVQPSNYTYLESLSNDVSESCQEDIPSEPSQSGDLQHSTGPEINYTKQELDSLSPVLPSFGLLPEAAQVNREEMPPLPPLPPMQWRLGKIQHAPLDPQREFMDHSLQSYPSILPFRDHEKSQSAFPAQQSDIIQSANPFLPVSAVEVEKSRHVSEQVDNVMQPTLSSLYSPFMANDANIQTNSYDLEGTQSLNPFLTLLALPDEKPEHGFLTSEHEVVRSSSNPFLSLPAVEDAALQYDPVSSSEKLIHSLNQSASEPGLQHTSENLEGEHGNPSYTSVLPRRNAEDTASTYDPVSSSEKPIHPLNQSASEPGLQHVSENLEGEHGNHSDMSVLPPSKVEDTASTYDPVSSPERPIHPLNQSATVPALQNASEKSEEEHRHPSYMFVLPPRKVEEQPQHGLPSSEGESVWPSNPFALLAISEVGKVNGSSILKLPRPRNPLIDAIAAHDKSKLRKMTERVRPQSEPEVNERNLLQEQIRIKSFNLKPAVVSRPSIKGPKTNLRFAAILEKANAIRQATAGSDEDDDEDWHDS